jgi:hypothetical protein
MSYDIIIVGGGISGIYLMYQLIEKHKHLKVLLLESNQRFGGRVHTHYEKIDGNDYVVDLGAGRLGFHHNHIMELVKKLNLEKDIYPISNTSDYIEDGINKTKQKNGIMKKLYDFLNLKKIKSLSNSFMQRFTFKEFLEKYLSKSLVQKMIQMFEYTSDFTLLNAYDSSRLFKSDYKQTNKYFVLKNGIQSITDTMISRIKKHPSYPRKFSLKNGSMVTDIQYTTDSSLYQITYTKTSSNKSLQLYTKKVVCALPRKSLSKFDIFNPYHKEIDSVQDVDLLRIYEIYQEPWFKNIPKTITNNQLQYIIPINPESGLIMSSYTDLKNSKYWLKLYTEKTEVQFKKILHAKLKSTFKTSIPDSKWLKFSYWDMGVAVWKKGTDSNYLSEKILHLMPNLYICGENYSTYQAWCEGALVTSKKVFEKITCDFTGTKKKYRGGKGKKTKKKQKKLKRITMDEVKKHNTKDDAWIVIDKKVYNITSWISKHPGGMVIMKGVGKDATNLFRSIGHPSFVERKLLPKFLLGEI